MPRILRYNLSLPASEHGAMVRGGVFEMGHPWNTSNTPLRLKWGTFGTLPTPKKRHGVPLEPFQHFLRLKWGTLGTLPTPPQIEMGHPWNPSNTPSD